MMRFVSSVFIFISLSVICRADESLIAKVTGIEYPPYTTSELAGAGIFADVAAPCDWLLSFFPPREGYSHVRTLVLTFRESIIQHFSHTVFVNTAHPLAGRVVHNIVADTPGLPE